MGTPSPRPSARLLGGSAGALAGRPPQPRAARRLVWSTQRSSAAWWAEAQNSRCSETGAEPGLSRASCCWLPHSLCHCRDWPLGVPVLSLENQNRVTAEGTLWWRLCLLTVISKNASSPTIGLDRCPCPWCHQPACPRALSAGCGRPPDPQGSPGTSQPPPCLHLGPQRHVWDIAAALLVGWVLIVGDAIHVRFSDVHTVPRCAGSLPTSSRVCHTVPELLPRGHQPLVLQPQAVTGGPVPIPERKALKERTSGPEPQAQAPAGVPRAHFAGGHPGPCGPSGRVVSVALH